MDGWVEGSESWFKDFITAIKNLGLKTSSYSNLEPGLVNLKVGHVKTLDFFSLSTGLQVDANHRLAMRPSDHVRNISGLPTITG